MRGTLVATCLVLACAHQRRPPPLTGWRELRSAHFRLQTDLSPEAARVTLHSLEVLRAALQSAWADAAGRALAVLPHRESQLLLDTLVRDRALIRSQCPRPTGNLH